jgi:hypothetical protein
MSRKFLKLTGKRKVIKNKRPNLIPVLMQQSYKNKFNAIKYFFFRSSLKKFVDEPSYFYL